MTKGFALVGAVSACVFAAIPASALAVTTVGQTGAPVNHYQGPQELVMASDVMPTAGVVTSLSTQSSPCDLAAGTYDLQVLRPEGTDSGNPQYLVLGDTGDQVDPCDSQLHSYPVDIPVHAGDVIGAYAVTTWEGVLTVGTGTDNFDFIPQPAVGDTFSTTNTFADIVDESATLTTTPPNRSACKLSGWQNYVDDNGQPFKNRGQCVAWASRNT